HPVAEHAAHRRRATLGRLGAVARVHARARTRARADVLRIVDGADALVAGRATGLRVGAVAVRLRGVLVAPRTEVAAEADHPVGTVRAARAVEVAGVHVASQRAIAHESAVEVAGIGAVAHVSATKLRTR